MKSFAPLFVFLSILTILGAFAATNEGRIDERRPNHDFAFGADLSFLKQTEDPGRVFKDGLRRSLRLVVNLI
ncbi:MAG TPA: hypothetical protein VEH04_18545 [Verrucomicrobiae bacterium]|nr:hypothetical protein [Verrucomicrobiae bacterium]